MSSTKPDALVGLVDCNNFYVSCEKVFRPHLEGKPVIVVSSNDGCVISRSNEAKILGITMAEPAFLKKEFLSKNNVAVFSSNFTLYGDLSDRVMKTISEHIDGNMEIYSVDEAFIDFSGYKSDTLPALSKSLKNTVKQWTGIPVSIGIGPTKTLAKVAIHLAKKACGVHMLHRETDIQNALMHFPVEKIWGVGRRYGAFLQRCGMHTAWDLRNADDVWIHKNLTITGVRMVHELRGIPCIPLQATTPARQTICTAPSFGKMTGNLNLLREALATYASRCAEKLRAQESCARIVIVFLETNRFREDLPQYNNHIVVRLPVATNDTSEIISYAVSGLEGIFREGYQYKKTGIIVSELVPQDEVEGDLFDGVDRSKRAKILRAVDLINSAMGRDVVRSAAQGFEREWKLTQEQLSPCYTSRRQDFLTEA